MNTLGIYNETMIKADADGYFSLTEMWKANGKRLSNRPSKWLERPKTINLLKVLQNDTSVQKSHFDLIRTQIGGKMPGTWGVQKVAIAYAAYLSPAFHAWVLESVSTFVAMEKDPELGLSRYSKNCIRDLRKAGPVKKLIGSIGE